jgi:hypothetical protein
LRICYSRQERNQKSGDEDTHVQEEYHFPDEWLLAKQLAPAQ